MTGSPFSYLVRCLGDQVGGDGAGEGGGAVEERARAAAGQRRPPAGELLPVVRVGVAVADGGEGGGDGLRPVAADAALTGGFAGVPGRELRGEGDDVVPGPRAVIAAQPRPLPSAVTAAWEQDRPDRSPCRTPPNHPPMSRPVGFSERCAGRGEQRPDRGAQRGLDDGAVRGAAGEREKRGPGGVGGTHGAERGRAAARIHAACASVSTLLTSVGRPSTPLSKTRGGLATRQGRPAVDGTADGALLAGHVAAPVRKTSSANPAGTRPAATTSATARSAAAALSAEETYTTARPRRPPGGQQQSVEHEVRPPGQQPVVLGRGRLPLVPVGDDDLRAGCAWATVRHLTWVGNPAPPRPRRPASAASSPSRTPSTGCRRRNRGRTLVGQPPVRRLDAGQHQPSGAPGAPSGGGERAGAPRAALTVARSPDHPVGRGATAAISPSCLVEADDVGVLGVHVEQRRVVRTVLAVADAVAHHERREIGGACVHDRGPDAPRRGRAADDQAVRAERGPARPARSVPAKAEAFCLTSTVSSVRGASRGSIGCRSLPATQLGEHRHLAQPGRVGVGGEGDRREDHGHAGGPGGVDQPPRRLRRRRRDRSRGRRRGR